MRKLTQLKTAICLLMAFSLTNTASYAAFPIQQTAVNEIVVNNAVAATTTPVVASPFSANVQAAPEFEGIKAKGKSDPGVLSFILSMVGLALLALGGIVGGILFPLLALIPAGIGIYYGVKGFDRHNKGFAIAGFVISILVALSALGRIL
ncbi:MAG: hypothetical protein EOP56_05425 [Sphingobacteriales bacterium]|nr:MAG: hypothetical protein EOP56_05425 [Sphingobacteriales bacterium]